MLRSSSLQLLITTCLVLASFVRANTEIINFPFPAQHPPLPNSITPKPRYTVFLTQPTLINLELDLGSQSTPRTILIEYTVSVDEDSWRRKVEKFQKNVGFREMRTLRVSYPATHPVDFKLELYEIPSNVARASSASGGYLLLTSSSTSTFSSSSKASKIDNDDDNNVKIPLTILVEPIYFGVVPESSLATILLVCVVLGSLWSRGITGKIVDGVRSLGSASSSEKEMTAKSQDKKNKNDKNSKKTNKVDKKKKQ